MLTMKTTINNGLPCLAKLTYYKPSVADDCDYGHSYGEIEFDLYTRKGKIAPWMMNAASKDDLERIEFELVENLTDNAY